MNAGFNITILGLSITSSWGNGHATTFRALVRGLVERGHRVLFLERDVPWYGENRDLPHPPFGTTRLYRSVEELTDTYADAVQNADLVMVGSYVPDGVEVAQWVTRRARGVTAFYDLDTPVTLAKLAAGDYQYLTPELVPAFDLYLTFTGGPTLRRLERQYGASLARPLYCSFDPELYFPEAGELAYDLGYMGTYSEDRQGALEEMLLDSARALGSGRFVVAGPLYPDTIAWPANVARIDHLPPGEHRRFYCQQRFTLNVTRRAMIRSGYSPSVRLFEAAACATPVISDRWPGLKQLFVPGEEILIASSAAEVLGYLHSLPESQRRRIAQRARARVLADHTPAHRACELEQYMHEAWQRRTVRHGSPRPRVGGGSSF